MLTHNKYAILKQSNEQQGVQNIVKLTLLFEIFVSHCVEDEDYGFSLMYSATKL
jgi:hypothetical protein